VDIGLPDVLQIDGVTAECVGTIAWQAHIPIDELTVRQASLEEAFMTLTGESVEYRSTVSPSPRGIGQCGCRRMTTVLATVSTPELVDAHSALRVTQARVLVSEWTKFRSLRFTVYTLLIAVVFPVGLGAMFAAISAGQSGRLEPGTTAISTSLTGPHWQRASPRSGGPGIAARAAVGHHVVVTRCASLCGRRSARCT
jgi:hypothetical protein